MTTTNQTTVEQLMNGIQAGAYKLVSAQPYKKVEPSVEYAQNGRMLHHYSGSMLHIYVDVTYKVVKETFGSGDSNPDPDDSGLNILGQTMTNIRLSDVLDCLIPSEYETLDGSYNQELRSTKFNDVPYYIHKEIVEAINIDSRSDDFGTSFITEAVLDGKRVRFLTVFCNNADCYFTYEYKQLYPRYYEDYKPVDKWDLDGDYIPVLVTVNSFEEDYDYINRFMYSNTLSQKIELLKPEYLSID